MRQPASERATDSSQLSMQGSPVVCGLWLGVASGLCSGVSSLPLVDPRTMAGQTRQLHGRTVSKWVTRCCPAGRSCWCCLCPPPVAGWTRRDPRETEGPSSTVFAKRSQRTARLHCTPAQNKLPRAQVQGHPMGARHDACSSIRCPPPPPQSHDMHTWST